MTTPTFRSDDLDLGPEDDEIDGLRGNDTIIGNGGDDLITDIIPVLSGGNDVFDGRFGNDTLIGGVGHDSLLGGNDDDLLFGDTGRDTLRGGNGDDTLDGGFGEDTLDGNAGDDVLLGGAVGSIIDLIAGEIFEGLPELDFASDTFRVGDITGNGNDLILFFDFDSGEEETADRLGLNFGDGMEWFSTTDDFIGLATRLGTDDNEDTSAVVDLGNGDFTLVFSRDEDGNPTNSVNLAGAVGSEDLPLDALLGEPVDLAMNGVEFDFTVNNIWGNSNSAGINAKISITNTTGEEQSAYDLNDLTIDGFSITSFWVEGQPARIERNSESASAEFGDLAWFSVDEGETVTFGFVATTTEEDLVSAGNFWPTPQDPDAFVQGVLDGLSFDYDYDLG